MSLSMGHPRGCIPVSEADLLKAISALLMCWEQGAVCCEQRDAGCELEQRELSSNHGLLKELLHRLEGPAAGLTHLPGLQEATFHKKMDATCKCAVSEDVENGICSSDDRVREPLDPQGTSATGHGHRSLLSKLPGEWFSCHPVLTLVLILLVVALAVALAVQSAPQVRQVLGCPPRWVGYNGFCYYFSRYYRTWDQAQEQCSELGASLAIVKDEAMDLLFRLGGNGDYWVGLRRWGEHLQWGDGSSFSSSVPVLGISKCVYLAEEKFRSESCSNRHRYLCSKPRAPL
ncbi:C-type lectin domain family 2 member D2-like [Oenanthe melanoleuca]|uniref:C-type lectin domain family 2 member D2-like n=1 Tax=Oenanthe melanoleuca TaxID=2939378 RepID=UPI0024C11F3E|nr:C-type lectin domain family 2 member D2-like [Oenanthe melanoleuca]